MLWRFENLGYNKDLKEMDIYNHTFLYPFYAASSRGPFFTFAPSLRIKSKELMNEINLITSYQILMNCTFAFGERLNRHLGESNIRGYKQEENIINLLAHQYSVRINTVDDYEWTLAWFKHYIENVCFPLVNQVTEQIDLFNFLKNIFKQQIEYEKGKDIRELMNSYEISIGHNEIITMIYLGYKHEQKDIHELAKMASEYKKGPLYHDPIIELIHHFENREL